MGCVDIWGWGQGTFDLWQRQQCNTMVTLIAELIARIIMHRVCKNKNVFWKINIYHYKHVIEVGRVCTCMRLLCLCLQCLYVCVCMYESVWVMCACVYIYTCTYTVFRCADVKRDYVGLKCGTLFSFNSRYNHDHNHKQSIFIWRKSIT